MCRICIVKGNITVHVKTDCSQVFLCAVVNCSLKPPYFFTSCLVYLFDSAFKRILINYNSSCSLHFFIFVVVFSRIMFFKLHFV